MPSRAPSASPGPEQKDPVMVSEHLDGEHAQHELKDLQSQPPLLPIEEDLMALARLGELRSIQKLFDSGKYTASWADEQGITALHWAAINGHFALCHFLIQAGANVNAKGGDAQATPVLWASKKCNLDIVNLLLQNGADPLITDDSGYNLLHCATLDGNVFQLILLLHHPDMDVDVPDSQGHTSLMWAAYKGYPACVDVLLRWGASVNVADNMGFTALHWALVKGTYGCIQKIVEYGADRFAANNEGKTPAVTAKEMNSSTQWHRALVDSGYDKAGNAKEFPLSFVKDQRQFISRFFFCWPFVILGSGLYIASMLPIYTGLPIAMATSYGLQWLAGQVLKWAPSDMKHIHKTPFLAGIFAATLAWVSLRWALKILPNTWASHFFLNVGYLTFASLCLYFYCLTMLADPGFVPKGGSRGQQKTVIEELLSSGIFDEKHFCSTCMIRKPLRSKHCKRCNRCVAREDHHCPWVDNCVGVNNHRHFLLYTIFLLAGISFNIRLTIAYIEELPMPPETHCAFLTTSICTQFAKDPFTIIVDAWGALQLTWVTMLLFVHLSQIARAMTTYESMRGSHATGPVTTALATGSTSLEGAQLTPAGAGPDPAAAPVRRQKEGCFTQWKKLLGLDTFIATAMHGSKADEVLARRRQNPFTRGVVRNCSDFWCDAGGVNGLFRTRDTGVGLLGGEKTDYRRLYTLPVGGQGMRYRSGGYETVPDDEEV